MADKKPTEDSFEQTETLDKLSSDVVPKEKTDSVVNVDRKPRLTIRPPRTQHPKSDDEKSVDKESLTSEPEDEDPFDAFILSNFNRFSGSEDVIEWLDLTDEKFNVLKISRKLRYAAIPLLVSGKAKRAYLHNKAKITTYDEFYTFLLTQYDVDNSNAPHPSSHSSTSTVGQGDIPRNIPTQKKIIFDDQRQSSDKTFDVLGSSPQPPILRSTALLDLGATDVIGDAPVSRSNILASHNSLFNTSQLDQTSYALRRAIVDSLIKTPKTFRGKEDVKQWLEDIEQAFDTAQIPESLKIDLVQHSLRGEALRWFKNNKSTFTSWSFFVKGLKEMFLSPFFQEIAFKKLESYSQGVNQPIRSFYNEVLKLCTEADPSMSDSSKLRHLLNKTNSTLQFEIRLKGPTTTKQYLNYAIEFEELFHLSNINISNNSNTSTTPTFTPTSTITSRQSIPPPKPDKGAPSATDREVNYDNTYHNSNNRNNNHNPSRSSQPFVQSTTIFRSNHRPRHPPQPPPQPVNPYSQDARHQQGGYLNSNSPSSTTPSKPSHRSTNNTTNPTYNNNNQRKNLPPVSQANSSSNANIRSILDPLSFSPPITCSRCSQQGHLASECPHF